MYRHRPLRARWAGMLACLCTSTLLAAPYGANPPQVRDHDGIAYISGGIGSDEAGQLRAMASRFNVHMRFVDARTGESMSDVAVVVVDTQGKKRLSLVTEGPLLYLKLHPGTYRAYVTYQGSTQSRPFTAGSKPVALAFRLAVNEAERSWLYCASQCTRSQR